MTTSTRPKPDTVLLGADAEARRALETEVAAADIGAHLEARDEGERVVSHLFECLRPGYAGWRWSVTIARASRQKDITVDEMVLIPGPDAITAPAWVPYKDRIKPGDLSPGDLLPVEEDDPRIAPTYLIGDDAIDPLGRQDIAQIRQVADELGLGRVRTLSREGIDEAAERWYAGDGGPAAPIAQSAPDHCYSCAFLVRLSGRLAHTFGVCANGNANDDGRVVTFNHGCGAHSEAQLSKKQKPLPLPDHVFDTVTTDDLESF
ncbi:DUF3027 domain-containing protein [Nocardioides sp. AE5]|uniref:DUF3027 domain-containing protein n=1 Tax=Nocardioides sp. AE5 TaxID=2962573 RepID=UPI00288138C1|nr:DUF3027 domain-containing protein [Nocardioides sp. AE5]MDT0203702.1 DUF3027 domain-containing protein [Nocardioides sp. AE5]